MSSPHERAIRAAYRVEHNLFGLENRTLAGLKADLEQARLRVIATLASASKDWQIAEANGILQELERELAEWGSAATGKVGQALPEAADLGQAEVVEALRSARIRVDAAPYIDRAFVATAYQTLPHLISGVTDQTVHRIGSILRQAVLAQQSPFDAMRAIGPLTGKGVFPSAFARAEAIVRTELCRISQTANYATMEQLNASQGLGLLKEWSAVVDFRTRESHALADGQRRELDQDFSIGGYPAKYPHDPRLPASESVHCRCIVVPYDSSWDLSGEHPGWHELTAQAAESGLTVSAWGDAPTSGYMVSPYKSYETKVPVGRFDVPDLQGYMKDHLPILREQDHYLGAWQEEGNVWLDVSVNAPTRLEAAKLAVKHQQEAVFDLASGETVYTKDLVAEYGLERLKEARRRPHLFLLDPDLYQDQDQLADFVAAVRKG